MTTELRAIDSVSATPEEYPTDDDPYLPKWAVTVFFRYKDEAEDFIEQAQAGGNDDQAQDPPAR